MAADVYYFIISYYNGAYHKFIDVIYDVYKRT